jgi:hypothetical protein
MHTDIAPVLVPGDLHDCTVFEEASASPKSESLRWPTLYRYHTLRIVQLRRLLQPRVHVLITWRFGYIAIFVSLVRIPPMSSQVLVVRRSQALSNELGSG